MNSAQRLVRKIKDVRKYPALADSGSDRRDLFLLGLTRNRLLSPANAARFTSGKTTRITPRLKHTRGLPVAVDLAHAGQVDCFDELFIDHIYDLSVVRFAPTLVVDAGGYCGYFSTLATGWFPSAQIECFEANPDNLPALGKQLALLPTVVTLHPSAVFVRDGTILFSGSGVGGAVHEEAPINALRIACIDFPAWLRAQKPARLICKLDVEGAEKQILPALLPVLPAQTVLYLETHYSDVACDELLSPYRAAGFRITEVRRRVANSGDFSYVEWILIRD